MSLSEYQSNKFKTRKVSGKMKKNVGEINRIIAGFRKETIDRGKKLSKEDKEIEKEALKIKDKLLKGKANKKEHEWTQEMYNRYKTYFQ